MDNFILIVDNETGELYKSAGTKEEAIIAFIRNLIKENGIDEVCEILDVTLKDISSEDIKSI